MGLSEASCRELINGIGAGSDHHAWARKVLTVPKGPVMLLMSCSSGPLVLHILAAMSVGMRCSLYVYYKTNNFSINNNR